jgi:hypothetical protein
MRGLVVGVPSESVVIVLCDGDGCDNSVECNTADGDPPDPWRTVEFPWLTGSFHACSDVCATSIMEREERTP